MLTGVTSTRKTAVVPSAGAIGMSNVITAFGGLKGSNLGGFRGTHPLLPATGAISMSNLYGLSAIVPTFNSLSNNVSGTGMWMSNVSGVPRIQGYVASSQTRNFSMSLSNYIEYPTYQGAMTYTLSGIALPAGVTMSNNGNISCVSISNYGISQSNTILATNMYSNFAAITMGFDFMIPSPLLSNATLLMTQQATSGSNTPYNLSTSFPFATQFAVSNASAYPGAATIASTSNLVVIGAYRGTQYSISVTGSNSSGACNVPVTVYESGQAVASSNGNPTFGTFNSVTQTYPMTWKFTLSNCNASTLSNTTGVTSAIWTPSNNFLAGTLTGNVPATTNPKCALTLTWSNTANYLTTYNSPTFQSLVNSPTPATAPLTPSTTFNSISYSSYTTASQTANMSWKFNPVNVSSWSVQSSQNITNISLPDTSTMTGTITANLAFSVTFNLTYSQSGYLDRTTTSSQFSQTFQYAGAPSWNFGAFTSFTSNNAPWNLALTNVTASSTTAATANLTCTTGKISPGTNNKLPDLLQYVSDPNVTKGIMGVNPSSTDFSMTSGYLLVNPSNNNTGNYSLVVYYADYLNVTTINLTLNTTISLGASPIISFPQNINSTNPKFEILPSTFPKAPSSCNVNVSPSLGTQIKTCSNIYFASVCDISPWITNTAGGTLTYAWSGKNTAPNVPTTNFVTKSAFMLQNGTITPTQNGKFYHEFSYNATGASVDYYGMYPYIDVIVTNQLGHSSQFGTVYFDNSNVFTYSNNGSTYVSRFSNVQTPFAVYSGPMVNTTADIYASLA